MGKPSRAGPDEVSLGWIVGVFGVRGEVRLHLHNRSSQLLRGGQMVDLLGPDGTRQRAEVKSRPGAGGRVLGAIAGIVDREQARALMGTELVLAKSVLPNLEVDEYYHHQLIGLEVVTEDGRELGRLCEIHDHGSVDVWVVRGSQEYLLPALARIFVEVDVAKGRAVVANDAVDP